MPKGGASPSGVTFISPRRPAKVFDQKTGESPVLEKKFAAYTFYSAQGAHHKRSYNMDVVAIALCGETEGKKHCCFLLWRHTAFSISPARGSPPLAALLAMIITTVGFSRQSREDQQQCVLARGGSGVWARRTEARLKITRLCAVNF